MKHIVIFFLLMGCSFKVPPITITNAQTAAEKQMVGEDRELEKEGWMIGSIQSSTNGQTNQEKSEKEDSDPEIRAHRIRLNYLSPEIKKYKSHGILGETPQGFVKLNPLASSLPTYIHYELPAKRKRVEDVILFLNESRKFIMEKELSSHKKKGMKEDELVRVKQSLIDEYYKTISIGEYYETGTGRWEKYQ